jgi:primosomal replication protein N
VSTNEVVLSGMAQRVGALRYTPVGIPVIEFSLQHVSRQQEAGATRQVEVALPTVVFGALAEGLAKASPGSEITARGFLAKRSRDSAQVVLHATSIEY